MHPSGNDLDLLKIVMGATFVGGFIIGALCGKRYVDTKATHVEGRNLLEPWPSNRVAPGPLLDPEMASTSSPPMISMVDKAQNRVVEISTGSTQSSCQFSDEDGDPEICIEMKYPDDLKAVLSKLAATMQQRGISHDQVSGEPTLTFITAAGKTSNVSGPEDLEDVELPGQLKAVFKLHCGTTAEISTGMEANMLVRELDVEALRHALVKGNSGPQADETKMGNDIKVTLSNLQNSSWQCLATGKNLASFLCSEYGTVRLFIPMDSATRAVANVLVLDQGTRLQQLRNDCLLFTAVDYSHCMDPDEASIEDFAVTFESTTDCERFKATWQEAANINSKVVPFEG